MNNDVLSITIGKLSNEGVDSLLKIVSERKKQLIVQQTIASIIQLCKGSSVPKQEYKIEGNSKYYFENTNIEIRMVVKIENKIFEFSVRQMTTEHIQSEGIVYFRGSVEYSVSFNKETFVIDRDSNDSFGFDGIVSSMDYTEEKLRKIEDDEENFVIANLSLALRGKTTASKYISGIASILNTFINDYHKASGL